MPLGRVMAVESAPPFFSGLKPEAICSVKVVPTAWWKEWS